MNITLMDVLTPASTGPQFRGIRLGASTSLWQASAPTPPHQIVILTLMMRMMMTRMSMIRIRLSMCCVNPDCNNYHN